MDEKQDNKEKQEAVDGIERHRTKTIKKTEKPLLNKTKQKEKQKWTKNTET